jgi:SpoIID/LytB domain protein
MSPSFLYSSAFNINKNDNGNFVLKGKGWGHGVGLCQIGALGMAISKKNTNSILTHYYPGTQLKTIYNK